MPSARWALDAYSWVVMDVVERVGPAVVQIGVAKAVNARTPYGVLLRMAEGKAFQHVDHVLPST